jgi:uncharacterized protein YciI
MKLLSLVLFFGGVVLSASMKPFLSAFRINSKNALKMSTSSGPSKSTYILEYVYVADILEKRTPYRPDHIKLAEDYHKEGTILSGGPFVPPTGAMFVFSADGKEVVENFVKKDPYVAAGLVTTYTIKEWNVVIGSV